MSSFCTSCGAANTSSTFCTSCGAAMGAPIAASAPAASAPQEDALSSVLPLTEVDSSTESVGAGIDLKKKKLLKIGAVAVLVIGGGVGSFLAGKSSVNLKKEQKVSYDLGFNAGDTAGYDRGYNTGDSAGYDRGDSAGYSRGYSSGYTAGCESVFDNASYADHLIEYYPGNYYYRYGSTYVSKTGC